MDGLLSFLTPEQQTMARQQAQTQGLIGLGSSLLQASQGQPGQRKPSLGMAFAQAAPVGLQAYQGGMDQTLRDIVLGQQMQDAQTKRSRQIAIQSALQLPTTQAQINKLRELGAYETIGGLAASEKALRQSGLMRSAGDMALENPFSIYAQSEIPGVAKLGKQYQKAYESGNIDDEKATARLGELARMEDSAFARTESAKERADARAAAAADRALTRETTAAFRGEAAAEREQKRLEGTDSQRLASGFADRMVNSNAIIEQLEPSGGLPTEFTSFAGGVPVLGSYLQRKAMTPEQQKYKQAADNWIRANLRKESGAVIGADEMEAEYATYFPMPGEDPTTIAQKAEARKVTTQAMIKNAGPAFRMPTLGQRPKPKDVKSKFNLE